MTSNMSPGHISLWHHRNKRLLFVSDSNHIVCSEAHSSICSELFLCFQLIMPSVNCNANSLEERLCEVLFS